MSGANERCMRMASAFPTGDELQPEYDESVFENAERGKCAQRYSAGTNIVQLEPDVARDTDAVAGSGLPRKRVRDSRV